MIAKYANLVLFLGVACFLTGGGIILLLQADLLHFVQQRDLLRLPELRHRFGIALLERGGVHGDGELEVGLRPVDASLQVHDGTPGLSQGLFTLLQPGLGLGQRPIGDR